MAVYLTEGLCLQSLFINSDQSKHRLDPMCNEIETSSYFLAVSENNMYTV